MEEFSCLEQNSYHFNYELETGKHLPNYPRRGSSWPSIAPYRNAILSDAASAAKRS
jgi:hypothetical protein